MTSALAMASVTAVLRSLLENGLVERSITTRVGGDTIVSALPPDRVMTGADERPQLNVFLYHLTPHAGLHGMQRNSVKHERDQAASPLAFDLHYMLTAYGAQDFQIEILLGYAIQLMHGAGTLRRETMRTVLQALAAPEHGAVLPPAVGALASSDLADQVEQITITPQFLNTEEMSRLWSALQSRYRPSVTYKVSVVFIADQQAAMPN